MSDNIDFVSCPVCNRQFSKAIIEEHVNKCLFLNTEGNSKRNGSHLQDSPQEKRLKVHSNYVSQPANSLKTSPKEELQLKCIPFTKLNESVPLAEKMRPFHIEDIVGQKSFECGSMLRALIEQKKIPSMILWGPPGCGKTSLANVVAALCKEQSNLRFVKLSATTSGVNDVKEAVKIAKNEAQYKKQTIMFMDEIHRFNKLQQDIFLPHVENGTIILIGATTENPSFSLNNALLSRCRVVTMEKLSSDSVTLILERAVARSKQVLLVDSDGPTDKCENEEDIPRYIVERASLRWLADVCDGDARVALGALELALAARDPGDELATKGPALLTLDDIKNGIKRSHMLFDRRGEEHYNTISALHKAVRAGADSAALYWVTRALAAGEQPAYIARRLVRAAAEDIGLADPSALVEAVACLQGCQQLGSPESDVLLAQCAVRLARAPKSRAVYQAMRRCQDLLAQTKGPLPPVPFYMRNHPPKEEMCFRNLAEDSDPTYLPDGMENVDFFDN